MTGLLFGVLHAIGAGRNGEVEDNVRVDAGPSTGLITGTVAAPLLPTAPDDVVWTSQIVKEIIATEPTTISVSGLGAEDELAAISAWRERVTGTRERYVEAIQRVQDESTYVTTKEEGGMAPVTTLPPIVYTVEPLAVRGAPLRSYGDARYDVR